MQSYSPSLLAKVKKHLQGGGIIAYPTEFCSGFGCDPFNYTALQRIIRLKGRAKNKGLIVIAGRLPQLSKLMITQPPELAEYWPGFYSLILPVSPRAPSNLTGGKASIALRVSCHPLVQQLCYSLNMPLVSTSANKSGFKPLKSYRECQRQFGNQVLVLPGHTSFSRHPSRIIDWESKTVLR